MPSSLPSIINVRNSAVLLRISKFFVTIQGINNCRKHKVTEKIMVAITNCICFVWLRWSSYKSK